MGGSLSSLYESQAFFRQKLSDKQKELTRVLSKSNSMESLDKAEIKELKHEIKRAKVTLLVIDKALEDESAPSF